VICSINGDYFTAINGDYFLFKFKFGSTSSPNVLTSGHILTIIQIVRVFFDEKRVKNPRDKLEQHARSTREGWSRHDP